MAFSPWTGREVEALVCETEEELQSEVAQAHGLGRRDEARALVAAVLRPAVVAIAGVAFLAGLGVHAVAASHGRDRAPHAGSAALGVDSAPTKSTVLLSEEGGKCRDIQSGSECLATSGCWPGVSRTEGTEGKYICRESEEVNCNMDAAKAGKRLTFFSSTALDTPEAKLSFRDLVLRLPDSAWDDEKVGAAAKQKAREVGIGELVEGDFHEPYLYSALKVALIEDACYLKESFWNAKNPNFDRKDGASVNFNKVGVPASKAVQHEFGELDGGWCSDQRIDSWGGFGPFGFSSENLEEVSVFGHAAPSALQEAIFELQGSTDTSKDSPQARAFHEKLKEARESPETIAAIKEMVAKLEAADIVAVNGGNPDFLGFVFTKFAPEVAETIKTRVSSGSMVYLSRSAGSMVSSADFGISYEPNPVLIEHMLGGNSTGLRLAGRCVIRPHYNRAWAMVSAIFADAADANVVRLPNGEGMQCVGTKCKVVGELCHQGKPLFSEDGDPNMEHLGHLEFILNRKFREQRSSD